MTRKARSMTNRRPFRTLLAVLAAALISCDVAPPAAPNQIMRPSSAYTGDLSQRQAAFLNRIRDADPQQRTIERAFLNEQNELGLILNRSVEVDKISGVMRAMLTKMAGEFPGQDLTVLAYTPSKPPRKIGTGRLNAQTRDMTYTPEY